MSNFYSIEFSLIKKFIFNPTNSSDDFSFSNEVEDKFYFNSFNYIINIDNNYNSINDNNAHNNEIFITERSKKKGRRTNSSKLLNTFG